jgi:hypothetical protein
MGIHMLVVIALETHTVTKIVLAMESGIIAINANANTANLGSITTIVLCSVIIIAIIIIANEAFRAIEMSISCRGCWGIRSAQWQGELDGPVSGHLHLYMPWNVRMLMKMALEI